MNYIDRSTRDGKTLTPQRAGINFIGDKADAQHGVRAGIRVRTRADTGTWWVSLTPPRSKQVFLDRFVHHGLLAFCSRQSDAMHV